MKKAIPRRKIAVVGSGISGMAFAYRLGQAGYQVTFFETNNYFWGHTHTVGVNLGRTT